MRSGPSAPESAPWSVIGCCWKVISSPPSLATLFPPEVFEPKDALLASGTAHDVNVSVSIQVHRLGIDGCIHLGQNVLLPAAAVERVVGNFKPRNFRQRLSRGSFLAAVGPLVGRNDLQLAVVVQVSKKNADERAPSRRNFRDHAVPAPATNDAARVLQVEQVAFLASHDGIGKAVAVQVANRHIFGSTGFGALGQREPKPFVGVLETERHAYMVAVFVDGNDVDMAVLVEVRHLQAIRAAQTDAAA